MKYYDISSTGWGGLFIRGYNFAILIEDRNIYFDYKEGKYYKTSESILLEDVLDILLRGDKD